MQEENELVERIDECNTVIRDIDSSPAWKVIVKDMGIQKTFLDDNWQNINDDKKTREARILKLAVMHVLTLKTKYQNDLKVSQERLAIIRNPESVVDKDYDTE